MKFEIIEVLFIIVPPSNREGVYLHRCVCLSVFFFCPSINKMPINIATLMLTFFVKWLLLDLARITITIMMTIIFIYPKGSYWNWCQRSRSRWRNIHFSSYFSFIFLLWISALRNLIEMKSIIWTKTDWPYSLYLYFFFYWSSYFRE